MRSCSWRRYFAAKEDESSEEYVGNHDDGDGGGHSQVSDETRIFQNQGRGESANSEQNSSINQYQQKEDQEHSSRYCPVQSVEAVKARQEFIQSLNSGKYNIMQRLYHHHHHQQQQQQQQENCWNNINVQNRDLFIQPNLEIPVRGIPCTIAQ